MAETANSGLKLNYKRTALIGFAFFGILLLWQVYDSWCPTFLTDIFARNIYEMTSAELKASDPDKILNVQWIVGIIMACDNLAALILLPIFGNLSDKTKTPIGKRMPYILVGTLVSAIAFPFIPLFFHYNNIVGMVAMMAIVLLFMMMYRNPAVALMPDITPKPLRAKANGIINIMGYFGGAFATVLGLFFVLSSYINAPAAERSIWTIELPFIVASVLMVVSAFVLFRTIRENELAAEAVGINAFSYKRLSFTFSAVYAGWAGALYAGYMMYIVPTNFALNKSIELITTTVIGGLGSLTGSVLGAMLVTLLPEVFRSLSNYRMLIYGFAVVLIIMFRPNGLYGYKEFSLKRTIAWFRKRFGGNAKAGKEVA